MFEEASAFNQSLEHRDVRRVANTVCTPGPRCDDVPDPDPDARARGAETIHLRKLTIAMFYCRSEREGGALNAALSLLLFCLLFESKNKILFRDILYLYTRNVFYYCECTLRL